MSTTLDTLTEAGEQVVVGLRALLAELQDIDFWPPWEVADRVVDLVSQVLTIATDPPEPSPETVEDVRAAWRQIDQRVDNAVTDLGTVGTEVGTDDWQGPSGDAFRSSVDEAGGRIATIATAAASVDAALVVLADAMTDARARHADGRSAVTPHLSLSWSSLTPWGLADYLRGIVGEVVAGVEDLIGAYEDAGGALVAADRDIWAAVDEITLPRHLPGGGGLSAVDLVNAFDGDRGPLRGGTLERYDDAYTALSPAERAAVDAALAAADSDLERAYLLQAVASGMTGDTLTNYAEHLATMDRGDIEDLDPLSSSSTSVTQPDQTTCGSSTLVMARMLNDPAYALWMRTGFDPETGATDDRSFSERFADESVAMHDRTNASTDRDGDPQSSWPDFLGTAPWGVANEMSAEGGSGVPGAEYGTDVVNPLAAGDTYEAIQQANDDGHVVPLYVGDEWSPRHVVLVTGTDGDDLTLYNPADGQSHTITRQQFEDGQLGGSASWDQAWLAVTPR